MIDFDNARKSINLIDFLVQIYGYQIDKTKTSRVGFTVVQKGDETLLVKKQTEGRYIGEWFFLNADNKNDLGNIVKFITSRDNQDIKTKTGLNFVKHRLETFDPNLVATDDFTNYTTHTQQNTVNKKNYLGILKLTDYEFLTSRGISKEVIENKFFVGKIFNKWAYDKERDFYYFNTVFPYFSSPYPKPIINVPEKGKGAILSEITGLEVKNNYFGSGNVMAAFSDKSHSVWMSNFDDLKPVETLYLAESSVDVISYFQLNQETLSNKNILFSSFGGDIALGQMKFIFELYSLLKIQNIVLLNDNDEKGVYYNNKIISYCFNKHSLVCDIVLVSKQIFTLTLGFNFMITSEIASLVKEKIVDSNCFKLTFDRSIQNLILIESFLLTQLLKHKLQYHISTQRATLKDFNDDLMLQLGLPKNTLTQEEIRLNNRVG